MSNVLTKNSLRVPGAPRLNWIPGTPGTPSYTSTTTTWVPGYATKIVGPDSQGKYATLLVSTGLQQVTTTTFYPAVPPTPGYYQIVPDWILDLQPGWNAAARSIDPIVGNGQYQFKVPEDVVGVVTGFNDASTNEGYLEIDYGLFLHTGTFVVMENGAVRGVPGTFDSTDVFTIRRLGTQVAYYKNSTKVYTSLTPSSGPLVADCSLYLAGDSIVDAVVSSTVDASVSDVTGGANGFLGGLRSFAGDLDAAESINELTPLTGVAESWAYGYASGVLGGVEGLAGNYAYAEARGILTPLTGSGESGMLVPAFAIAYGILGDMVGFSLGYTGTSGGSNGVLGRLQGLSANYAYCEARGILGPLVSEVYVAVADATVMRGTHGGRYPFYAIAEDSARRGFDGAHGGQYKLASHTSTKSRGQFSAGTLEGRAITTGLASAVGVLPKGFVQAIAVGTRLGGINAKMRQPHTVAARMGMRADGQFSTGAVEGIALAGTVGTMVAKGSVGTLEAIAVKRNFVRAAGVLPTLRSLNGAVIEAYGPRSEVLALSEPVLTVAYEGYSVTLFDSAEETPATTRVTACPFEHIVRLGAKYYGVAADGLYELDGDTYDGAPIVSVMETMPDDRGTPSMKRPRALFVAGRISGQLSGAVTMGEEEQSDSYAYQPAQTTGGRNHRIKFGRGYRSPYLAFRLTNVKGDDFQLDSLTPEFDVLRKAIGG